MSDNPFEEKGQPNPFQVRTHSRILLPALAPVPTWLLARSVPVYTCTRTHSPHPSPLASRCLDCCSIGEQCTGVPGTLAAPPPPRRASRFPPPGSVAYACAYASRGFAPLVFRVSREVWEYLLSFANNIPAAT